VGTFELNGGRDWGLNPPRIFGAPLMLLGGPLYGNFYVYI